MSVVVLRDGEALSPAIVIVPVRGPLPVYWATDHFTVPSPLPLAPEVMVIQVSFDVAVHAQLALVDTAMSLPFCASC